MEDGHVVVAREEFKRFFSHLYIDIRVPWKDLSSTVSVKREDMKEGDGPSDSTTSQAGSRALSMSQHLCLRRSQGMSASNWRGLSFAGSSRVHDPQTYSRFSITYSRLIELNKESDIPAIVMRVEAA